MNMIGTPDSGVAWQQMIALCVAGASLNYFANWSAGWHPIKLSLDDLCWFNKSGRSEPLYRLAEQDALNGDQW